MLLKIHLEKAKCCFLYCTVFADDIIHITIISIGQTKKKKTTNKTKIGTRAREWKNAGSFRMLMVVFVFTMISYNTPRKYTIVKCCIADGSASM